MAAKRPFKIWYHQHYEFHHPKAPGHVQKTSEKVGRVVAVSSPEAIVRSAALALIRGQADTARVLLDNDIFARMTRKANGDLHFEVY